MNMLQDVSSVGMRGTPSIYYSEFNSCVELPREGLVELHRSWFKQSLPLNRKEKKKSKINMLKNIRNIKTSTHPVCFQIWKISPQTY